LHPMIRHVWQRACVGESPAPADRSPTNKVALTASKRRPFFLVFLISALRALMCPFFKDGVDETNFCVSFLSDLIVPPPILMWSL